MKHNVGSLSEIYSCAATLLTLSCCMFSLFWFSWLLRKLFSWWRILIVWPCCAVTWVLLSTCSLRIFIIFSWSFTFSPRVSLSTRNVWYCLWASSNLSRCWKNHLSMIRATHSARVNIIIAMFDQCLPFEMHQLFHKNSHTQTQRDSSKYYLLCFLL